MIKFNNDFFINIYFYIHFIIKQKKQYNRKIKDF